MYLRTSSTSAMISSTGLVSISEPHKRFLKSSNSMKFMRFKTMCGNSSTHCSHARDSRIFVRISANNSYAISVSSSPISATVHPYRPAKLSINSISLSTPQASEKNHANGLHPPSGSVLSSSLRTLPVPFHAVLPGQSP